MRKQITQTRSTDAKTHEPRILSSSELQQAVGGVMKSRHDTVKNAIGNIR